MGIAQWRILKQWKIQTSGWILATTLGWALFGTVFKYTDDYFVNHSFPALFERLARLKFFIAEEIIMLITGISIGTLQSIAARKSLPRPGLWILVNMAGGFVISMALVSGPFGPRFHIINFFYSYYYEPRYDLLRGFLLLSLLAIGFLTSFILTGRALLKSGVPSLE
jgi:hypothetical protein